MLLTEQWGTTPPARPDARRGAPHAQRRTAVLPLHDGPAAPLPPWGAGTQLCARRRGLCYFAFVVTRWRGPHGRSEVRARRWRWRGSGGGGPEGAPAALPHPPGTRCRTAAVGRPRLPGSGSPPALSASPRGLGCRGVRPLAQGRGVAAADKAGKRGTARPRPQQSGSQPGGRLPGREATHVGAGGWGAGGGGCTAPSTARPMLRAALFVRGTRSCPLPSRPHPSPPRGMTPSERGPAGRSAAPVLDARENSGKKIETGGGGERGAEKKKQRNPAGPPGCGSAEFRAVIAALRHHPPPRGTACAHLRRHPRRRPLPSPPLRSLPPSRHTRRGGHRCGAGGEAGEKK